MTYFYACSPQLEVSSNWRTTHYPNGKLKDSFKISDRVKNIKNGPFLSYYPNGNLQKWCYYKMDTIHGKQIYYNSYGEIRSFKHYQLGQLHGYSYTLYPNGCIRSLDTFYNGQQIGKTTVFDSSGKVLVLGSAKSTGFECGACFCK